MQISQPLRVGIGGPVGSGKTALTLATEMEGIASVRKEKRKKQYKKISAAYSFPLRTEP